MLLVVPLSKCQDRQIQCMKDMKLSHVDKDMVEQSNTGTVRQSIYKKLLCNGGLELIDPQFSFSDFFIKG